MPPSKALVVSLLKSSWILTSLPVIAAISATVAALPALLKPPDLNPTPQER